MYLECDQEEVIGESAHQGEYHLGEDEQADPTVITGDIILTPGCQVV